ncbi:MAG: LPP20 family lipoprotein [Elusimicrobiota bacterium]
MHGWLASLLLILPQLAAAQSAAPAWVRKRPASAKHYIGVGMARRIGAGPTLGDEAKGRALADLSSEIMVTVSSEFIDRVAERAGLSEDEVRSDIRSTTEAQLQDYDTVDTWSSADEYWVYLRIKKSDYQKARLKRKQERSLSSLDLWEKGLGKEARDAAGALALYIQALCGLQEFLGESVEVARGGSTVLLTNEVTSSLQSLLGRLQLSTTAPRAKAVSGRGLELELPFTASAGSLPVSCAFIRGQGTVSERVRTDDSGAGSCRVLRIASGEKMQTVEARLDLLGLVLDEPSRVVDGILRRLPVPAARFDLEVAGLPVYVDASETNLGKRVDVPQLVPALGEALAGLGFSSVDSLSRADIVVELRAASRPGGDFYGMHIAYVDVTVTVTDRAKGEELYKGTLQDAKGMHPDARKAGLKAFESASSSFKAEILPAMLERLGR